VGWRGRKIGGGRALGNAVRIGSGFRPGSGCGIISRIEKAKETESMAETSREIMKQLPYLRRYARAISGSQERGDQYIRVALETIVQEPGRIEPDGNVKLQLFQLFHEVWAMVDSAIRSRGGAPAGRTIEAQLGALPPLERQALLLVSLERFSVAQAAEILRKSAGDVRRLIDEAREDLKRQASTTILII
jgi:DNA-directed RNA polymerase specialized sigma24 family protein